MITLELFKRFYENYFCQLTRNYRPHLQPFILIYPTKLLYNIYSRCNVISHFLFFSFSFLSIVFIESLKHLIIYGALSTIFLYFSLFLSFSRRMTTAFICIHAPKFSLFAYIYIYVIFSSSCFFFLFFFVFLFYLSLFLSWL